MPLSSLPFNLRHKSRSLTLYSRFFTATSKEKKTPDDDDDRPTPLLHSSSPLPSMPSSRSMTTPELASPNGTSGWRLPKFSLQRKKSNAGLIMAQPPLSPVIANPSSSLTIDTSNPSGYIPSSPTIVHSPTQASASYEDRSYNSNSSETRSSDSKQQPQTATVGVQSTHKFPSQSAQSPHRSASHNPLSAAASANPPPRKERFRLLSKISKNDVKSPQPPLSANHPPQPQTPKSPVGSPSRGSPTSSTSKPNGTGSAASRFIRRVASAPNAKRLFSVGPSTKNGLLAAPAESDPIPPLPLSPPHDAKGSSIDTLSSGKHGNHPPQDAKRPSRANSVAGPNGTLTSVPNAGQTPRQAFRRTYSSNSIKVKTVQVAPSSFQKIKLLGRGDVGRVYLVREKKTDKLFAMKGMHIHCSFI